MHAAERDLLRKFRTFKRTQFFSSTFNTEKCTELDIKHKEN